MACRTLYAEAMRGGRPPTLIVLRGNSGSGKTSVALGLRARYGRGLAVVSQDTVRRDLLRERDVPNGVNIGLIDTIVRYTLDRGYHVVLEGILTADRYAAMLEALRHDHPGPSLWYYLDVSLQETLRRHDTRPQRHAFGAQEMQEWYQERDLLPDAGETIIGEASDLDTTVRQVLQESGLRAQHPPARSPWAH
ncbi:MAG: Sli3 [Actinomycetia bacterium]|nr:Sli3 [Actinomycetes bacterium]